MLSKEQIKTLLLIKNRNGDIFSSSGIPRELIIQHKSGLSAENALQAIIEADYRKLAKIIEIQPKLMFSEVKAHDIDGEVISTSPLYYALTKLDTLAWKYFEQVCSRSPEDMDMFIATVCSVEEVPNLTPLYKAYQKFYDLGKKYHDAHWSDHNKLGPEHMAGSTELEALKESWLLLGMQQRHCLPRHILKDMCPCDLIYSDVLLMRTENLEFDSYKANKVKEKEFLERLRNIMVENNYLPIILFNGSKYQVVYLGIDYNLIQGSEYDECGPLLYGFSEEYFPFEKIDFPEIPWTPVKKRAEQNDDNLKKDKHRCLPYSTRRMWKSEKDLSFPLNSNELYLEIDFLKKEAKTKHLFPLIENSGLGYDFALARGFCGMSLGLSDPRGACTFLFAKANEDCNGIKEIVAKRIEERSELIKNYSAYHATSFSVGGLKN